MKFQRNHKPYFFHGLFKIKHYLLIIFTFILASSTFGQIGKEGRTINDPYEGSQQGAQDIYKQAGRDAMNARSEPFYPPRRALSPLEKEEAERFKALVVPHPEDTEKYKGFLEQSRAGIFLLYPDFDCESKFVIKVDNDCINIVPGASTYSFRRKNHATDLKFFDIQLKGDELISQGFLTQGILTALGDVPLEAVSPTSVGIKFLADFKPEKQIQEVRNQFKQISNGIKADGYTYTNVIKAETNMTYALRVVAYRRPLITVNRFSLNVDDKRFATLINDKRKDLTLAFRVIRKDADGRITILWKELISQSSPKLVYQENERLSDIKPKN